MLFSSYLNPNFFRIIKINSYNHMAENKLKHLEFIQNVITRMNSNSFLIKGWTITLVSALFAFAEKGNNTNMIIIDFIIIPSFWVLDGFYLSQERQYRGLYDEITKKEERDIDYNMNAAKYNTGGNKWLNSIFSKILLWFYLLLFFIVIVVFIIIKNHCFS